MKISSTVPSRERLGRRRSRGGGTLKKVLAGVGVLTIGVLSSVILPTAAMAQSAVQHAEIGSQPTTASSASAQYQGETITINYGVAPSRVLKSITSNGYAYKVEDGLSASTYADIYRVDNENVQGEREIIFLENNAQSDPSNIRANEQVPHASMADIFGNAVLSSGSDNVFANTGGTNINNIERISILNNTPLESSDPSSTGIVLLERGGNDRFKVAAVTAVDGDGKPIAWGEMVTVELTDWGVVDGNYNSTVFRQDSDTGLYNPTEVSNPANQEIAGVLVTLADLGVTVGQTVYGVSLLPVDALDPAQTDPILTTPYSGSDGGGLDFIGGAFVNAAPIALPQTSTGDAGVPQTVDLEIIPGDSTDAGKIDLPSTVLIPPTNGTVSDDGLTVTVPGQGVYVLDPTAGTQGQVTFTPEPSFQGDATPITYRSQDGNGQETEASITIRVNPVAPTANPDTSSGLQGVVQRVDPLVNDAAGHSNFPLVPSTVTLLGTDGNPTESITVPGEGTYTVEYDEVAKTVRLVFTPEPDFYGTATPAPYRVSDSYGTTAKSTYTPTVIAPPSAEPSTVRVNQGDTATLTPDTTLGSGALTKVEFDNGEFTKEVLGEGTWAIELVEGEVVATFTPEDGFVGPVTQQGYTVTDENDLEASSTLDVIIRPAAGNDAVIVNQGEAATMNPDTTPGSADLESVAFDNGETTKEVLGEGTWAIELVEGEVVATFTPDDGFTGPVTQQGYTVIDTNDETASGTLDVIIRPVTADDEVTINPNETATLDPETAPGSGDIESVAFDNDETTKVVDGEGTWTIELVDGQPVATFTPEPDYHGPVTPQEYTITDTNGESAKGELRVNINEPPQAGDDAEIIKPNETATLTPETTPGNSPIVEVEFDNGETTKEVPGEGTWTVELVDGEVVVTFTPEPDYDGPVTQQPYTITDGNGNKASGTLDVTIIHTGLLLEKGYEIVNDANDNGINDPGDVIRWTFTVTNTGNVALENISVEDPLLTSLDLAITCDPATELAAGAVSECVSGEYTITDADVEAGSILNVAIATGEVPEGTPGDPEDPTSPLDEVEIPITPTPVPAISLEKDYSIVSDANDNGINDPGDIVRWTFTVTNTGNVTLENVSVDDPKLDELGIEVTCDVTPLLPGLSTVCVSGEYTITDADVEAGSILNVAIATGEVPEGTPGDPEDPTSPPDEVEIPTDPTPAPGLDLEKKAFLNDKNGDGKADVGETIGYSFTLKNTGNTVLTDVYVADPMLEKLGISVTCAPTTLLPGGQASCVAEKSYTVTAQDAKNGKVYNVATGHATPPTGVDPIDPPKDEVDIPTGPVPPGTPPTGAAVTSLAAASAAALIIGGVLVSINRSRREKESAF